MENTCREKGSGGLLLSASKSCGDPLCLTMWLSGQGPLAPYIVLEIYYIEIWRLEVLTRHYKLTLSLASGFEYSAQHFLSFNFQDDPKDIVSSVCVALLLS